MLQKKKNQRKSLKYITKQWKNNIKSYENIENNAKSDTKVRLRKYKKTTRHGVFINNING